MLLVTTSQSILLIDESSGELIRIESGNGLYYGIAQKDGRYYVAARRRMVSSSTPIEMESGEIRIYDAYLRIVDVWTAPFPLRDMHQICFVDDALFVTCSYDNAIAIRHSDGIWEKWYPLGIPDTEPLDRNHFNSISYINGRIFVVAHNHETPSAILEFDGADRSLISRATLGAQAHNVWFEDEVMFTCSSGEGSVRSSDRTVLELGSFPRGFAQANGTRFFGISEKAERQERDFTNSKIAVVNEYWEVEKLISLPGEGLVLDLLHLGKAKRPQSASEPHRLCWCGSTSLEPYGPEYGKCCQCGTLVYIKGKVNADAVVRDDEHDLYGKKYWLEHQQQAFGFADIHQRSRDDLTERNLHWLKALFKYRLPSAKVLELGCSHGGYVALMRLAGYDAVGVEMSPWVVSYGQRIFGAPIHIGPIERLGIEPGSLDVIVLMDVLEHLQDPVSTLRHCVGLLKREGLLFVQTPKFKEDLSYDQLQRSRDRFIGMMIPEEHIYLFSEKSVELFFSRLGVEHVRFEPAIFSHYDMFFVASREPLQVNGPAEIETVLLASPNSRFCLAMLELRARELDLVARLQESEADRAARLEQILTLTALLKASESDRPVRSEQTQTLANLLKKPKKAIKSDSFQALSRMLHDSEQDRTARGEQIAALTKMLQDCEEDRLDRGRQIETLTRMVHESEADRAARGEQIEMLTRMVRESESGRAAQAEQIEILNRMLRERGD